MSNPNGFIPTVETNDEYLARCEHDQYCAENGVEGYTDWSFYDEIEEWN